MTDAIDGFVIAVGFLVAFLMPLLLLIALYEWVAKNRLSWLEPPKPSLPPRPDLRIPERERALLGDDYREVVAPYFARRGFLTNDTGEHNNDAQ